VIAQEKPFMSKVTSGKTEVHTDSGTERLFETDVDPELERQLSSAKNNESVEAVLVLRQRGTDWPHPPSPAALLRLASRGEPAGTIERTILPRLGVLIVRAHARVIRRLIAQPAVAIASMNRVGEAAKTEPLRRPDTRRSRRIS
jgi:hypothetical protein